MKGERVSRAQALAGSHLVADWKQPRIVRLKWMYIAHLRDHTAAL